MSLPVDLFRGIVLSEGPLYMGPGRRSRFERLRPIFVAVGRGRFEAALLAGIAWTESDFVATAVNKSSGASGLMQIMPFHHERLGLTLNRWTVPDLNIKAGLRILIDSGLGHEPISVVLARYGGFRRNDPFEFYIPRVLKRSSFLLPGMFV